jgi:hypothetical protein
MVVYYRFFIFISYYTIPAPDQRLSSTHVPKLDALHHMNESICMGLKQMHCLVACSTHSYVYTRLKSIEGFLHLGKSIHCTENFHLKRVFKLYLLLLEGKEILRGSSEFVEKLLVHIVLDVCLKDSAF